MTDPDAAAQRLRAYLNARPDAVSLGATVEYGPEFTAANSRPAGVYALDRADLTAVLDERDRLAALAGVRQRVIERMARESLEAEAAVQRVRETCDRWDGFSPATRRHSIIVRGALDGPRHGEAAPSGTVTNHAYEGAPGAGSACQAEAFGEACGAPWEQHEMRETGAH